MSPACRRSKSMIDAPPMMFIRPTVVFGWGCWYTCELSW